MLKRDRFHINNVLKLVIIIYYIFSLYIFLFFFINIPFIINYFINIMYKLNEIKYVQSHIKYLTVK